MYLFKSVTYKHGKPELAKGFPHYTFHVSKGLRYANIIAASRHEKQ